MWMPSGWFAERMPSFSWERAQSKSAEAMLLGGLLVRIGDWSKDYLAS